MWVKRGAFLVEIFLKFYHGLIFSTRAREFACKPPEALGYFRNTNLFIFIIISMRVGVRSLEWDTGCVDSKKKGQFANFSS